MDFVTEGKKGRNVSTPTDDGANKPENKFACMGSTSYTKERKPG